MTPWLQRMADRLNLPAVGDLAAAWYPAGGAHAVDLLIPVLLRIRAKNGQLLPLVPNAAQRRFVQKRARRNIILKARQLGMTTFVAARYFLLTALRPGTVSLQVAHSLESAQQIFRIVHRFYENLSGSLGPIIKTERSNVRELAFAGMDSRYRVDTAGNPSAGRGLTVSNLHCSEVALWPGEPEQTMAALLGCVPPDGCVDVESTPNGVGGLFHREWMLSVGGDTGYVAHFFPWWLELSYRRAIPAGVSLLPLSEQETELVRREGLDLEQIYFRRELEHTYRNLRTQEYAEDAVSCFLATGRPVFDVDAIDRRVGVVDGPRRVAQNQGEFEFCAPQRGRRYVIGADVAEGREDGDFSVAQVVDVETGLQCLEMRVRWPIERFAEYLAGLGERFNGATLAVERNNHGHAVLYALRNRHRYVHLFAWSDGAESVQYGFPTNAQTKPQVIGALSAMLGDAPATLMSRRLLEEMRAYRFDDDGGMGAPSGMHDDTVMAMGIALVVRGRVREPFFAGVKR